VPHSNFDPELKFDKDGVLTIAGPLGEIDSDAVKITVTASVTQAPPDDAPPAKRRTAEQEPQQGATCADRFELTRGRVSLARTKKWKFAARAYGGPLRTGWAFASAELIQLGEDGGIEKYTWSQWVWLRP
jgi:hypothetical protein